MSRSQFFLLLLGGFATSAVAFAARTRMRGSLKAPRAAKKPHAVKFGKVPGKNRGKNPMDPPVELMDDYFWIRDDKRKSAAVLSHVRAENAFAQQQTSHLESLRDTLNKEFLSHLKETDMQVPYPHGPYFYYSRTEKGKSYKIHCRSKELHSDAQSPLQVILDVNAVAEGKEYCDVGAPSACPGDHAIVAYAVDFSGYETYDIRFRDPSTGEDLEDVISGTSGDLCWGADASTLFYTVQDEEHRPYELWMHTLGTPKEQDRKVYTEENKLLWMSIGKSDSRRFLLMNVGGKTMSEERFMDLEGVRGGEAHRALELKLVTPREEGVLYDTEHWGDKFFIVTNRDGCKNGKLVSAPISSPGAEKWEEVIPYDPERNLKGVSCFKNHLVIGGREGVLSQLWVRDMRTGNMHRVDHAEEVYTTSAGNNFVFDTPTLRFGYSSMVSPRAVYDYNMDTRERVLLKETEVPLYDRSKYACKRTFATAPDGVKVPMSMVYRKDIYPDGPTGKKAPCMLYGYGSYGHTTEPDFSFLRLSYLDRGMCYVMGHIRGGGEMGRPWYEDQGKFLTKRNTFQDFITCADHLVSEGVTAPDRLAVCGCSAGGLLIGAVVNMRPDLLHVAVADVPFVDIMNTMSDESIPLTVVEWEEWGNPNEAKYFDYMLSYSPYDNVRAQPYPAMLVTGGLNDPRVPYWEPVKWAAKLRDMKTDTRPLLCKIDMAAGHFSASDRYKYFKDAAFEYAFVLDQLGCTELHSAASSSTSA